MQTCANATTVAFSGLEARRIEVQVQMTGGTPVDPDELLGRISSRIFHWMWYSVRGRSL